MFEELTQKLETAFKNLRGHGKLSEKNISDSMREIRRVLLEADVHYKVVKDFIAGVQEKAVGVEVLKSITPGQQVVKVVHDALVELLGKANAPMHLGEKIPSVVMVVGLQGSGKTTTMAKLGVLLQKKGKKPLLVAADTYRPAAVDQLKTLGQQAGIQVFSEDKSPVDISADSITYAAKHGFDTVLLDTAGRLHVDEDMMIELEQIKGKIKPAEILFVADSMTGQDAVRSAESFLKRLDFNGVVLTKLDGDAKGGAALSIRAVTGKPVKFITTSEKLDGIEAFHPDRMASRILGMGDVVSLVEKAQDVVDQEQAEKLAEKLKKQEFTLEDFLDQLQQLKKMGPMNEVLGMLPGMGNNLKGLSVDDSAITRVEALIGSMTYEERRKPHIINGSRRKRIAMGSGSTVQDVNRLLKQFHMMQKMMKQMGKQKGKRMVNNMPLPFSF